MKFLKGDQTRLLDATTPPQLDAGGCAGGQLAMTRREAKSQVVGGRTLGASPQPSRGWARNKGLRSVPADAYPARSSTIRTGQRTSGLVWCRPRFRGFRPSPNQPDRTGCVGAVRTGGLYATVNVEQIPSHVPAVLALKPLVGPFGPGPASLNPVLMRIVDVVSRGVPSNFSPARHHRVVT